MPLNNFDKFSDLLEQNCYNLTDRIYKDALRDSIMIDEGNNNIIKYNITYTWLDSCDKVSFDSICGSTDTLYKRFYTFNNIANYLLISCKVQDIYDLIHKMKKHSHDHYMIDKSMEKIFYNHCPQHISLEFPLEITNNTSHISTLEHINYDYTSSQNSYSSFYMGIAGGILGTCLTLLL